MKLRRMAHCVSTEPHAIIEVPSQTKSNIIYEVRAVFPDDLPDEFICSCAGYHYRGRCAHQAMAYAGRCLWTERDGPEELPSHRSSCPRCGGEINFETEIDES